jgi:hypothetical protein
MITRKHKQLEVLIRDYGYRWSEPTLIRKGIKGFTSDQIIGNFRDIHDAAAYLIPIIKEDKFRELVLKSI